MLFKLIILFITVPLIELYLLIKVGGIIGAGLTIGIAIFTGILGASLARWQGFKVFNDLKQDLLTGIAPTDNIIQGVLILLAGLVLLTPGFLTDILGFSILIPFIRRKYVSWLKKYFSKKFFTEASSKESNYIKLSIEE